MPVLGHFIIPLGGQGTSKKLIGSERGYKTRENFESGGHRKYFKAVKNSLALLKPSLARVWLIFCPLPTRNLQFFSYKKYL